MMPEIWHPTLTSSTGSMSPVAVTTWTTSPRETVTVEYSGAFSEPLRQKYHPPATMAATTITMRVFPTLEREDVAMRIKREIQC